MQPRTTDQIYASLGNIYDPQANQYNSQLQGLAGVYQGKIQADEQALHGQQQQANDDIMLQARKRGVGYGGIPMGEQFKYNANTYMPALTKMRTSYAEQEGSDRNGLLGAINQLYAQRWKDAMAIGSDERDFYEKQREFNAEQARLKAGSGAGGFPGLNLDNLTTPPAAAGGKSKFGISADLEKRGYDAIVQLLKTNNAGLINKTLLAMRDSASRGGPGAAYDKYKLDLFHNFRTQKGWNTAGGGPFTQNPYMSIANQGYSYKAPVAAKSSFNPGSWQPPSALNIFGGR